MIAWEKTNPQRLEPTPTDESAAAAAAAAAAAGAAGFVAAGESTPHPQLTARIRQGNTVYGQTTNEAPLNMVIFTKRGSKVGESVV